METRLLQTTRWLSKRLGLSVSTIERLRAQGSPNLPPHVIVGNSMRYDNHVVEEWLTARQQAAKEKLTGDNHAHQS